MAVRSACLYVGQPAAGVVTLYTCPAGVRTIVKSWQAMQGNATTGYLFMLVDRAGAQVILHPLSAAAPAFAQLASDHWFVLEEGDKLICNSQRIGAQVIVAGAALVL